MTPPETPDGGNVGTAGGSGLSPGDGPPGGESRYARPQGVAGATARGGDRLPPVTELVVASLALMLTGGVLMAAHLPDRPPLGPPIGLLAAGAVLTTVAVVALSRARPFAWGAFFLVVRWALLAYAVIAGMLMFVFVKDGTSGATLAVLVATLVVFAVDVPTVMAFTVARYQGEGPAEDAGG
ncbi:MAG: hypothetical protein M0005_18280 [Actinomycetota bacterium]|nr:hypothetical protein [Actinomycetota bacterium]